MRSKKASLCYIQCSSWKHTSLFWACYLYPKMRKLLHFFCRKMSWTPTFVILFSANLVFYKDQKAAAQVPFDSTNWNFGQVVKICNFANFKITEMWPFLLCHVEGFSKVSPAPPPHFLMDIHSIHNIPIVLYKGAFIFNHEDKFQITLCCTSQSHEFEDSLKQNAGFPNVSCLRMSTSLTVNYLPN